MVTSLICLISSHNTDFVFSCQYFQSLKVVRLRLKTNERRTTVSENRLQEWRSVVFDIGEEWSHR